MEAIHQRGQPRHDRFGTGHADDAAAVAPGIRHMLFEFADRAFDALCIGEQFFTERGEFVAGRLACRQFTAQLFLELAQSALDGRLVDAEHLRRSDRAALARDGQEVSQVVPVEHATLCDFAAPAGNLAAAACALVAATTFLLIQEVSMTATAPKPIDPGNDSRRRPAASGTHCASGWNDKSAMIRNWLRDSTDAMLAMADIKAGCARARCCRRRRRSDARHCATCWTDRLCPCDRFLAGHSGIRGKKCRSRRIRQCRDKGCGWRGARGRGTGLRRRDLPPRPHVLSRSLQRTAANARRTQARRQGMHDGLLRARAEPAHRHSCVDRVQACRSCRRRTLISPAVCSALANRD